MILSIFEQFYCCLTFFYSIRIIYYLIIVNFSIYNYLIIVKFERKILILSIVFIRFIIIFFGSFFIWLIFYKFELIILELKFKFLSILVLVFRFLVAIFLYFYKLFLLSFFHGFCKVFHYNLYIKIRLMHPSEKKASWKPQPYFWQRKVFLNLIY